VGKLIDFADYVRNRRKSRLSLIKIEAEATEEVECAVGPCPTCEAPAYAFPDFEQPEAIQFAPDELESYFGDRQGKQAEVICDLIKQTTIMQEELDSVSMLHEHLSSKLSEVELQLENNNLAELLSRVIEDHEDEEAVAEARELLDERNERIEEREGDIA
jgi:hypothetical protein